MQQKLQRSANNNTSYYQSTVLIRLSIGVEGSSTALSRPLLRVEGFLVSGVKCTAVSTFKSP